MSRSGAIKFHEVNEVPYGVFSILSPHPIVVRHVSYPSAYHYFLCQKFRGTDYEHTIRQANSLWEVDRFVRRAEGLQRPEWDNSKMEVMLLAVYYKFKQNPEIQALLLSTGGKTIVNHTSADFFWGDGGDGSGKNIMGVILMAVRKRLGNEDKLKKRTEATAKPAAVASPLASPARRGRAGGNMWAVKLIIWLLFTMFFGPTVGLVVLVLAELLPLPLLRNRLLHQANLARGDVLAAPITEKHVQDLEDEHVKAGTCAMQGWRRGMEDAHLSLLRLSETHPEHKLFGVFDGHCGPDVARWVGRHLPAHIESSPHFDRGDYDSALTEGFVSVDRELLREKVVGGSTGVVTLVTPNRELICANVGDSRCIVSEGGKAVHLSVDHKPTLPDEHERVVRCGGFVAAGRVMGSLAMSRAFGDFTFKPIQKDPANEMVTVVPEIMKHTVTPATEFMVLACDGIWDCCSNQEVVDHIRKCLSSPGTPLTQICATLFDNIISPRPFGLGCDNMSMQLIIFKHPQHQSPPRALPEVPSSASSEDTKSETGSTGTEEDNRKVWERQTGGGGGEEGEEGED